MSRVQMEQKLERLLYTFVKSEGITCEMLAHLYSRCNAVRSSYLDRPQATLHDTKPGYRLRATDISIDFKMLSCKGSNCVTLTIKSRGFIADRFLRECAQHVHACEFTQGRVTLLACHF